MKKDKVYAWCSCGYSGNQPLCDGTHLTIQVPKKDFKPVRFIPDKDMEVWLCNCKQTNNRPFCGKLFFNDRVILILDGSHKNIRDKDDKDTLFD